MACWLLLSGEVNKNLLGSPGCDFFSLPLSLLHGYIIQSREDKVQPLCLCVSTWEYLYGSACVRMCVNANLCLFQGPGPSPPSWIHFTSPYCHPRMSAPWSNFLSAIIWWVRTVSHWQVRMTLGLCGSWLLNVALAPYQAPVCLVLTAPTGLATGGRLLGQLATEGCNHSLWHIWHKPSICSTTESFEWLPCLILLGQEMATLRWEINIWKTLYTPTL